jgi:hypothetical protein
MNDQNDAILREPVFVQIHVCGKTNFIRRREMFIEVSGPQDSAQGVTEIVDNF